MRKVDGFTLAADVVLLTENKVLLVKRKNDPYKDMWVLPGGFVDINETTKDAALRELNEETSVSIDGVKMIGVFDDPDRDPRGRVVSVAYLSVLDDIVNVVGGDDASDARWFDLDSLPELGFDHKEIIIAGLRFYEKE